MLRVEGFPKILRKARKVTREVEFAPVRETKGRHTAEAARHVAVSS